MTVLALPARRTTSRPACVHRAALPAILRRLGVSLLVACAVPAALLAGVLAVAGVVPAVLSALAWSLGAIGWRAATGRPTSGLLLLTATILTVRTLFTVSTGNTFVYFLQPVVSDAVVAAVFLLSLVSARPLVARLAADFYPMSRELAAHPRVRALFRRLTVLWGLVCLTKAGLGYWLLETLSMTRFVMVNSSAMIALTLAAVGVTVAAALLVLRRVDA